MALNKYTIYNTAFRLLRENQRKPSRNDVHNALGGAGSKSTIQKYMVEWEREHASAIQAFDVDQGILPDSLMGLVIAIYEESCHQAAEIVAEGEQGAAALAREAREELETSRKAFQVERDNLERSAEFLKAQLNAAEGKYSAAQTTIESLKTDLDQWRTQANTEHRRVERLSEAYQATAVELERVKGESMAALSECHRTINDLTEKNLRLKKELESRNPFPWRGKRSRRISNKK